MLKYLLLFVTGAGLSFLLTPLVRWVAIRNKVLDMPEARKVHSKPIPRLGGVGIFLAFILTVMLVLSPWRLFEIPFADVGAHWSKGFMAAAGIIVALGILDDLKPLGARVKFLTQVLAALVAISFGYVITHVDLPGGRTVELGMWAVPVTLVWIVGLTNAFNLIDGLDGLAAGVALIASLTLFGVALLGQNVELALLCALLAGCLLGFLPYNFHPASIFLGDSGSLFLGFLLAVLSITSAHKSTVAVSLLIPILAFGLPIMDTLLAMLRRFLRGLHVMETTDEGRLRLFFLRGKTMFEADRDHIHHRLMRLGLYHRNAVIFLYAACAAFGGAALLMAAYRNANTGLVLLAVALAVGVAVRKLHYEELQLLRNGSVATLSRFPILGIQAVQIPSDLLLVSLAYYFAYQLRFEGVFEGAAKECLITTLPAVLLTKIVVFHISGLYHTRWRYAGVPELLRGGRSMVLGSAAAAAVLAVFNYEQCGWAVLVMDFFLMSAFVLGSRFSARLAEYYAQSNPANKQRVLIYGTGPQAALLIHELLLNSDHLRTPVGFIDEHRGARRKFLHGYPILGTSAVMPEVLSQGDITELIIAAVNVPASRMTEIQNLCRQHNVVVRQYRTTIDNLTRLDEPATLAPVN